VVVVVSEDDEMKSCKSGRVPFLLAAAARELCIDLCMERDVRCCNAVVFSSAATVLMSEVTWCGMRVMKILQVFYIVARLLLNWHRQLL